MQKRSLRELGIGVYEPKKRIEIPKEHAFPILTRMSHELMNLGGMLVFIPILIFSTVSGFFVAKKKIRQVQMNHEKVLDLRRDQKRRLNLR